MAKELVRELINAGVHFGHGVSRWNPKMAPYIFVKRGNIHIIDVRKTLKGLLIAKKLLADVVASGKDVVFVGTKRQSQKTVEEIAKKCQMHFISHRWLGGMLTNFRTIRSRLQRLEQLEAMQQDGSLEKESKKQGSRLKREMRKIRANLDGVRKMSRLPGAVVAVDARKEYLALREARKLGVATIALIDTDSDPDTVDVAIPANDDSIRAIELILNELAKAVSAGKTMMPARQQETAAPRMRRARSQRPALARASNDTGSPNAVSRIQQEPVEEAEPKPPAPDIPEPAETVEPLMDPSVQKTVEKTPAPTEEVTAVESESEQAKPQEPAS